MTRMEGGGGLGVWPNCHITFLVVKKSLIYSILCSIYGTCGRRGLLKTSYGGGGAGWKRQEYCHMIFERFLIIYTGHLHELQNKNMNKFGRIIW